MPEARIWTGLADETIKMMRADGQTWAAIGHTLGLSRNTVIERGRRLNAEAPQRAKLAIITDQVSDDPNRAPLPAGHPFTWGLLTNEDFPKPTEKNTGLAEAFMPRV
jgi:hypothetical protein